MCGQYLRGSNRISSKDSAKIKWTGQTMVEYEDTHYYWWCFLRSLITSLRFVHKWREEDILLFQFAEIQGWISLSMN